MNRFHTFLSNDSSAEDDSAPEDGQLDDDDNVVNTLKPMGGANAGGDCPQMFDTNGLKVPKSLDILDKRDDNPKHKRFTLWSDILMEEELNHSVSNSLDIKKRRRKGTKFDRKSENYSFWTKRQFEEHFGQQKTQPMDKTDNNETNDEKTQQKRKKNKKKRKNVTKSEKQVVMDIAYKLNEPKVDLLKRVCDTIGVEKASELCSAALDVQSSGGLMTIDGKRRRTSGGIFFHLLKNDANVTKDSVNYIFFDDKNVIKNHKKCKLKLNKKSMKRKQKKSQNKANCDLNLTQTVVTESTEVVVNTNDSQMIET